MKDVQEPHRERESEELSRKKQQVPMQRLQRATKYGLININIKRARLGTAREGRRGKTMKCLPDGAKKSKLHLEYPGELLKVFK